MGNGSLVTLPWLAAEWGWGWGTCDKLGGTRRDRKDDPKR